MKHNDDDDAADDLLLILLILLLYCLFVPTTLCLWVSFSQPLRHRARVRKFAFSTPWGTGPGVIIVIVIVRFFVRFFFKEDK